MKLYYTPGACSLAPHIVAREAGVPIELVRVDLATHRLADGGDYLRINPRGYVPLLELENGERLTEAAVLVQFLAEQGNAPDLLLPAGTIERVRVLAWLNFVATELHKVFSPWLWHKDTAESTRVACHAKLASRFAELDHHLAGRSWLSGQHFTVADAYAFAILNWCHFLAVDLTPYPSLVAYLDRVAARPHVQEALRAEGLLEQATA